MVDHPVWSVIDPQIELVRELVEESQSILHRPRRHCIDRVCQGINDLVYISWYVVVKLRILVYIHEIWGESVSDPRAIDLNSLWRLPSVVRCLDCAWPFTLKGRRTIWIFQPAQSLILGVLEYLLRSFLKPARSLKNVGSFFP